MDYSQIGIPVLLSFSPTLEDTDVGNLPDIEMTFSLEMDTVQFSNSGTLNNLFSLVELSTDKPYDLTYDSFDTSNNILTLQPASSLTAGELYQFVAQSDIESFTGRSLGRTYTWQFTVNGSSIATPSSLSPPDESAYELLPLFTWSVIPSATSYTVQYSVSPRFTDGTIILTGTPTSAEYSPAAASLTEGTQYFWRVRANGTAAIGGWSDYISFYYGAEIQSSVDTRVELPHAGVFGITSLLPEDAATNQTIFPVIQATFSENVDAATVSANNFYVLYQPLDNGTLVGGTVNGTLTIIGSSIVQFTPTDAIATNTRYDIYITGIKNTDGDTMAGVTKSYFTSQYSPLYVNTISVRAICGGFSTDFTDDLINLLIHNASLDVNRLRLTNEESTLAEVQAAIDILTYDMQQYVTVKAAFGIVQMKYFELLDRADTKKTLGDFTVDVGAGALTELGKLYKRLQDQLKILENNIMLYRISPAIGVRSSQWNAEDRYSDQSMASLRRETF
jgi:hypothetical protein